MVQEIVNKELSLQDSLDRRWRQLEYILLMLVIVLVLLQIEMKGNEYHQNDQEL